MKKLLFLVWFLSASLGLAQMRVPDGGTGVRSIGTNSNLCSDSTGSKVIPCGGGGGGGGGGAVAGSWVQISSKTLLADTASFSFTGIPATYTDLRLTIQARLDGTTQRNMLVQFNGDTGNNYSWQQLWGNSTTPQASSASAVNGIVSLFIASTTQNAAAVSMTTIEVPNYTGTTFQKNLTSLTYQLFQGDGITEASAGFYGGRWKNTAAINRIDVILASGNFKAGSYATLYGIGQPGATGGTASANYYGSGVVLQKIVADGTSATVDFQSIPQSFTDLEVRFIARDTKSAAVQFVSVKLNNDTTAANYTTGAYLYGNGSTASSGANGTGTTGLTLYAIPAATASASFITDATFRINGYAGTAFFKKLNARNDDVRGSPAEGVSLQNGTWKSAAAVNRITFTTDGTAFVAGSTFTLYGYGSSTNVPLMDIQNITATGTQTWTKPTWFIPTFTNVECWGGGGGGGGGGTSNAAQQRSGGAGGGGASYVSRVFLSSSLGTTESLSIATGGTGGAGAALAASADGTAGTAGNNTTFGTTVLLTAYGGGAGGKGTGLNSINYSAGGGGAGIGGKGADSGAVGNAPTATAGGAPSPSGTTPGVNTVIMGFGGVGCRGGAWNGTAANGGSCENGGGGGGQSGAAANGWDGGGYIRGSGGGGGGGGVSNTNVEAPGGSGGLHGFYDGSNGAGSNGHGGAVHASGSPGQDGSGGQGGGGSNTAAAVGNGGNGGQPGGGGGAGGAGTTTVVNGGNGGNGANGACRITSY